MRLVPQDEVLAKLAAIQSADALGRQLAQDRAIEKLAGMAGIFMAHTQDEESMDKLAQSMVYAGELSSEEYELLKEAGFPGLARIGKVIKSGLSGVKSRVGKVVKPKSVMSRQSRDWARTAPSAPVRKPAARPQSKAQSRDWGGQAPATPVRRPSAQPRGRAQSRDWAAPAPAPRRPPGPDRRYYGQPPAPAQAAPAPTAMSEGRVVRRVRKAGVQPQKREPIVEVRRRPGRVTPRQQAAAPATASTQAPASQAPGKVAPKQQAAAQAPGKVPPKQQAAAQAAEKAAPTAAQQAASTQAPDQQSVPSKGTGWGRALPYAAVGGLGYGLYKGVPWAARQMEQASTTPMAYGGGWSPVPYGYGHSPYGPHTPTMGMGA